MIALLSFLAGVLVTRLFLAPRPRVLSGPGLDVGGAVRRPETRESIRQALRRPRGQQ